MDRECARTDCARSHTPSEHGDGRASPFSSFTDTSIVLCVLERVHLGIGGTLDMCMRVTVKMALLAFCGPGKFRNGRARAGARPPRVCVPRRPRKDARATRNNYSPTAAKRRCDTPGEDGSHMRHQDAHHAAR